jgi:hypothetical protein
MFEAYGLGNSKATHRAIQQSAAVHAQEQTRRHALYQHLARLHRVPFKDGCNTQNRITLRKTAPLSKLGYREWDMCEALRDNGY